MTSTRRRRVLAAPSLGEASGGVGQVSAMLWDVMRAAWPDETVAISLTAAHGHPHAIDKLRFGTQVAARQILGQFSWILFTHVGLMRVQRFVPEPVRVPYGVFLHGIESWTPLGAADVALLSRASLRLCNSDFTARRTLEVNPGIGRIVTCPLALPSLPAPAASARPSGPTALLVGRMAAGERYKGHDQLIDVWPAVCARVPDARLVIAGEGDDRSRLETRARAGAAADRIRFTGFVDRAALDRLYAEASVFVLPSRGEGFGLVYLEAMAHGLPCIGSIHDAASEIVVDGETGLLVDPDDGAALARAVGLMLSDEPLRRRCGEAGYRRVATHFSRDRFRRQVQSELEQSFERPVRRPAVA